MNTLIAILFSLHVSHAQTAEQAFVERATDAYFQLRRANSPSGLPAVAFLVRENASTFTRTAPQLLWQAGGQMPDDTYRFDLKNLSGAPALTELLGPYSDFLNFLRAHREGYALLLGDLPTGLRARLISHVGKIVDAQSVRPTVGEKIPLRGVALLIEAGDVDVIARGMTVGQLRRYADRTIELDGYRLDLHSGFRLRSVLAGCGGQLQDDPTPFMPAGAPSTRTLIR